MLLRQSAAYGFSRALAAVFTLGAIAAFSRLLTPEQYGDYVLILAAGTLVNVVGFQWIRVSTLRYLPHFGDQRDRVLRTATLGFATVAVLVALLGLAALWFVPAEVAASTVVLALVLGWFELQQDIMRTDMAVWRYGGMTVTRAAIGLLVGYALVEAGMQGLGPVVGLAIAMGLGVLVFAGLPIRSGGQTASRSMLLEFLRYGTPLVVAYALDFVVSTSDRFLLLWLSSKEAAGIYSAGYDLAFRTVGFSTAVVGLAALPLAISHLESSGIEAARRQLGKNRDLLLAVSVPIVAVVALFADNIAELVLGGDFEARQGTLIPLVAVSAGLLGLKAYFADHAIHLDGRTGRLALVTATAAGVNVLLNLWLIPRQGEVGAALSTLVAYACGLLMALWVAHQSFGLPRLSRDVKAVVLAGAVLVAVGWQTRSLGGFGGLVIQLLVCALVYVSVLLVVDFGGVRSRIGLAGPPRP